MKRGKAAAGDEIEACFRQALAVARSQQTTLFELRASRSLVHLWLDQGKRADARHLLAPIEWSAIPGRPGGLVPWFREGLDTPDLIEASELSNELV